MKQKIAIVAGGNSSEYQISINSARELSSSLDKTKYNSYTVVVKGSEWTVLSSDKKYLIDKNDFSFEINGSRIQFDCVLMAIHGTPGEDGKLQSYFDLLKIPYTCSNVFTSALTFNKYACKNFLKEFGVKTAKSLLLRKEEAFNLEDILHKLQLPCFVKPNNSGSSFGISKVNDKEELQTAIFNAFAEDEEVIIEEYVKGTEVSCGLFKIKSEMITFPLTEIVSENDFFDYEAKYTKGKAEEITPARIPDDLRQKCMDLSEHIYLKLACSGLVRIDYIITKNTPYFLEINTVPGMSKESIVPRQIKVFGSNMGDILDLVIQDALNRNQS